MERDRILLIVDPQNDFITGTLPVPQAEEAMHRLTSWILEHRGLYTRIVVTMDQHPIGHSSFVEQGGLWPQHCVCYTEGAAIYPSVFEAILSVQKPIDFIEKGVELDRDEYSAFASQISPSLLEAEHIYLAGLAGDYCVRATEMDLLKQISCDRIERLESCIAYINPDKAKS